MIAALRAEPALPTQRIIRGWTLTSLLVTVLLGALALMLIVAQIGPALPAASLLAMLPVPFYVLLVLWLDRNEPEPAGLLSRAYFWGATGAIVLAYAGNGLAGSIAAAFHPPEQVQWLTVVYAAPVVEELAKAIVLWQLYRRAKHEFDNVTDGVIYAAMVGLGFAMTENILYYGRALNAGSEVAGTTFLLRGMISPYAHPLFTVWTGLGFGFARELGQRAPRLLRALLPLAGLALAMLMHGLWNGSATAGQFFPVYFLIMLPTLLGALWLVRRSLRRERAVLQRYLQPELARGELSGVELAILGGQRSALGHDLALLLGKGPSAWWRWRQLRRAACELAFFRWRQSRSDGHPEPLPETHWQGQLKG